MPDSTINGLKDIVTVIGVVIAATSLVFTAINTRSTLKTNRARFWLDLRDRFAKHDEVHRLLRPGGDWSSGQGPETAEDWARVEAYLGLFEHCEIMLDQGLIDEPTFREIYAYRLKNIAANNQIGKKLQRFASGWVRLFALMKRMEIEVSG